MNEKEKRIYMEAPVEVTMKIDQPIMREFYAYHEVCEADMKTSSQALVEPIVELEEELVELVKEEYGEYIFDKIAHELLKRRNRIVNGEV